MNPTGVGTNLAPCAGKAISPEKVNTASGLSHIHWLVLIFRHRSHILPALPTVPPHRRQLRLSDKLLAGAKAERLARDAARKATVKSLLLLRH
jgi:hypothetical protein